MEELIVKVLVLILRQLPSECILHITDYIENAFSDGQLLPLKQFHIEKESGKYYFELSKRCISYLIEDLPNYNWVSYLVHYEISHHDRIIMRVLDETIFVLTPMFHIPEDLVHECEQENIWIYVEDDIKKE
jgi:hypothetical protein